MDSSTRCFAAWHTGGFLRPGHGGAKRLSMGGTAERYHQNVRVFVLVAPLCGVTHPGALLRSGHGGAMRLSMGGTANGCHQNLERQMT